MIMAPSDPKIKNNANAFLLMISCVLVSDMSSLQVRIVFLTGYPNRSSWIIHSPALLKKRYFGSTYLSRPNRRLSQFPSFARITFRQGENDRAGRCPRTIA
jgi:hypothetical protein